MKELKVGKLFWMFVKVVTVVFLVLCGIFFALWTYQSVVKLQRTNACLEGRLNSLALLSQDSFGRMKGETGIWNESPVIDRVKKDVGFHVESSNREKGSRGAPGLPGRAGYKGAKGEKGVCGCIPPLPAPKPTIAPRTLDCRITRFGIPLHLAQTSQPVGFFMQDCCRDSTDPPGRLWVGEGGNGSRLELYEDFEAIERNELLSHYDLPDPYQGTENIIYNGTFIYHVANTPYIHKLELSTERVLAVTQFPGSVHKGAKTLYTFGSAYFDIAYDENGLWVFYRKHGHNDSITLSKLHHESLEVEMTWQVNLEGRSYANLLMVCGHVYLIRHSDVIGSCIEHVYDVYTQRWSGASLVFKVPYQILSMAKYNPVEAKVFAWDGGNLLEYVMLFD